MIGIIWEVTAEQGAFIARERRIGMDGYLNRVDQLTGQTIEAADLDQLHKKLSAKLLKPFDLSKYGKAKRDPNILEVWF
jgi:isoleucyl-tRNA synthetase